MKVGIYVNKSKDKNEAGKQLLQQLLQQNMEADLFFERERVAIFRPEILCVLGGDGTILSIAPTCADLEIPILGINLGNLGFLSEVEREDIHMVAQLIVQKKYHLEHRTMIQTDFNGKKFVALNDFVVMREVARRAAKVITVDAYVDGQLLDRYVGDGVIVSTPTGTTAYALSAGGAIISPTVAALQVHSICAHSLHTRPTVISDQSKVSLRLQQAELPAILISDGEICGVVSSEINITKYHKTACFLRFREYNFYSKLLMKLSEWNLKQ